jgi:hypothetical protein
MTRRPIFIGGIDFAAFFDFGGDCFAACEVLLSSCQRVRHANSSVRAFTRTPPPVSLPDEIRLRGAIT